MQLSVRFISIFDLDLTWRGTPCITLEPCSLGTMARWNTVGGIGGIGSLSHLVAPGLHTVVRSCLPTPIYCLCLRFSPRHLISHLSYLDLWSPSFLAPPLFSLLCRAVLCCAVLCFAALPCSALLCPALLSILRGPLFACFFWPYLLALAAHLHPYLHLPASASSQSVLLLDTAIRTLRLVYNWGNDREID